jgi:anti-anti-sigma factor
MVGLVSYRLRSSVVVVRAYGDIDATNAHTMTDYALGHATSDLALIVDLSGVDFFGTEGFSALHRVAVGCARDDRAWSLVPGTAVSRLLRICDPHGSLPAADTLAAALAIVQHQITIRLGSQRPQEFGLSGKPHGLSPVIGVRPGVRVPFSTLGNG